MSQRPKIKSTSFANVEVPAEVRPRLVDGFQLLSQLEAPSRTIILRNTFEFMLAHLPAEEEAILEKIEKTTGVSPHDARKIYRTLGTLISILVVDTTTISADDPEVLANDLCVLELISENDIDEFTGIIAEFKDLLSSNLLSLSEEEYAIGVLPKFSGLRHVSDLRMVPKEKVTLVSSPDSYEPKLNALIPIVTMRFSLANDDKGYFSLQMTKKDLVKTLNVIRSALKEVEMLEEVAGSALEREL